MVQRYAAWLSSWTMAVICVAGLCRGDGASETLGFGLKAMGMMAVLGAFIGWIGEQLVQQSIELKFRRSVDRFRTELARSSAQSVRATGAAGESRSGTAGLDGSRGSIARRIAGPPWNRALPGAPSD
jgi:hypothetical protein